MALQLGLLNGAVNITDGSDESLRALLALTRDRYAEYARAIDVGSDYDRATYWRIIFAMLSVHSPIDATFEAYRTLRLWRTRFGRIPSQRKLRDLLAAAHGSDGVVQFTWLKAGYVHAFDADWSRDKSLFTRNGDSDVDWRLRLRANVKGLGLAKASFAVALVNPLTSDVCCVDTHIYALLGPTGQPPRGSVGKRAYLAIESRIRALGGEYGLSTFAAQWAIWDAKRGQPNPHSALATI